MEYPVDVFTILSCLDVQPFKQTLVTRCVVAMDDSIETMALRRSRTVSNRRVKQMEEETMPADSDHFEYIAPNFDTNLLCINSNREWVACARAHHKHVNRHTRTVAHTAGEYSDSSESPLPTFISMQREKTLKNVKRVLCLHFCLVETRLIEW